MANYHVELKNMHTNTINAKMYNIHGIYMLVESSVLSANFIHLLLKYFETNKCEKESPDIKIVGTRPFCPSGEYTLGGATRLYKYNSNRVYMSRDTTLEMTKDGKITVFTCKHILPHILLQMIMVFKGFTLVHAASISKNGKAILFPSWSRAGKTTLIMRYLKKDNIRLLGDDFVFLSENGQIYNFPLPLSLNYNQVSLLSDSFCQNKIHSITNKILPSFHELKCFLRPLAAKFPKLDFVRNFWPGNTIVSVTDIIPKEKIATFASLEVITFLTIYSGRKPQIKKTSLEDLVTRTIGILYHELQQDPFWKQFILWSAHGIIDINEYFNATARILKSAFKGKSCQLLFIPQGYNQDNLTDTLIRLIESY